MPELAVSAFTTHEGLIQLSATGLRIVVIFFPIIGFQMVTSNFFQSIGMAGKAIFLSLTRQLLFLLPSIILLPLCLGVCQYQTWRQVLSQESCFTASSRFLRPTVTN